MQLSMNKIPWWMFTMMTMHVSRWKYKNIKSIQMFSFYQVSLYCDENANTLIKINQECEVSGSSVTTEGSSLPTEGKSSPTLLPSTGWSSWYTTAMAYGMDHQESEEKILNSKYILLQNWIWLKISINHPQDSHQF